jgi:hypothetical protein
LAFEDVLDYKDKLEEKGHLRDEGKGLNQETTILRKKIGSD